MIIFPMLVYALLGGMASTTRALGINCLGDNTLDACRNPNAILASDASVLVGLIDKIEDDQVWKDKDTISCTSNNICAFVQNTNGEGMNGTEIKQLAPEITKHGCQVCGSVPRGFPKQNNVNNGELTFHYCAWDSCH